MERKSTDNFFLILIAILLIFIVCLLVNNFVPDSLQIIFVKILVGVFTLIIIGSAFVLLILVFKEIISCDGDGIY